MGEIEQEKYAGFIDGTIKEKVRFVILERGRGLPLKDLFSLERKDYEIETTLVTKEAEIPVGGWAKFILKANGEKISELRAKIGMNFVEVENVEEIIKNFTEVKKLWFSCDICGELIRIIIYGPGGSNYEFNRRMHPDYGKELRLDFTAVYQKIKEIIWDKRDEIVKEKFSTEIIDTFDKLEEFRKLAENIIDSIKKPKSIKELKHSRHFFGEFDICSKCQSRTRGTMTLDEISQLLPKFCAEGLNKLLPAFSVEDWNKIKDCPVGCKVSEE